MTKGTPPSRLPVWFQVILASAMLIIAFYFAGQYWFIGPDFEKYYRPATMALLTAPRSVYTTGPHHFLAPWGPLLLIPTLPFALWYGQLLLNGVSFVGVFQSARIVQNAPLYLLLLATFNPHTFDLILRGNVDGLMALGLFMAWIGLQRKQPWLLGFGLWMLVIKPINVVLPMLFFLFSLRTWSWRDRFITALPIGVSLLISLAVFGLDFPLRYLQLRQEIPPVLYLQTSPTRLFDILGIPHIILYGLIVITWVPTVVLLWRDKEPGLAKLALAFTVNLTFTIYSLGYHYVLLAFVFVMLAKWDRRWLLAWFLTWTPFLRYPLGYEAAVIDHLYPLVLFFGAMLYYRAHKSSTGKLPVEENSLSG